MTRTRANVSGGKGEALPEAVFEAPSRGRCRARDRGHSRGATLARGHVIGAAPVRSCATEVSLEPQIDAREDQVPP